MNNAFAGRVLHFSRLPNTMRLIFIKLHEMPIDEVIVDYDSLPDSLQQLCVIDIQAGGAKKIERKVKVNGEPLQVKLDVGHGDLWPNPKSNYFLQIEPQL